MSEEKDIPAEENFTPESPPEEAASGQDIVALTAAETSHTSIQTAAEDMEVHHAHLHHKKKWQDYLFEFFMLFLAVSSGFFVENLREHYVEHERAKEYAAMLRKDLQADTAIINIIVRFRIQQKKNLDTLSNIIKTTPYEKIDQQQFLRLSKSAGQYLHLLSSNGTLQQLKSSGSLRYFSDTSLVYALTSYEEDLKHADYVQNEESQHCAERVIPFKFKHFNDTFKDTSLSVAASKNFPQTGLVDFDKNTMMEFYNLLSKCTWYNEVLGYNSFEPHKNKATGIIEMLEKEYHLQ